jgi:hypothetical protein
MTKATNFRIIGIISMLLFHIAKKIFKLAVIRLFDLIKLTRFENHDKISHFVGFRTRFSLRTKQRHITISLSFDD